MSSSSNPPISVVMSVYNGARFLDQAIDSIRGQTYGDFEFIIVDDGSTGATPEILARHAAEDSRIRILPQENRGLIESLNRGFAAATGTYIARMDADDVAKPYRLERELGFLAENPGIALVGGAIEVIDAETQVLDTIRLPSEPVQIRRHMRELGCALAHPTVLFRRSVLKEVAGFRKAYRHAEDYDLWLRMLEKFDLANLDEVLLGYRRHAASVSIKNAKQQALSALCARTTAKLRLEGRPDPTSNIDLITEAVLRDLGVTQETIGSAIFDNMVLQTEDAIRCGLCSPAAEFVRMARPHAPADKLARTSLELNRKAAQAPAPPSEKRKHRTRLLMADPATYWELFRPGTCPPNREGSSVGASPSYSRPSGGVNNVGRPTLSDIAMKDDLKTDAEKALAVAQRRIAELERELLQLRSGEVQATPFTMFPPSSLAWRVGGADPSGNIYPDFLISGFQVLHNLMSILARHGQTLTDFHAVLDFGCGCGRVTRFVAYERCRAEITGCDIDPEAIAWCQKNINTANFLVSPFRPPLPFADNQFDFIYSTSIFTHLSEKDQFLWLAELSRVAQPGALLILTTQSKNESYSRLPEETKRNLAASGFFYDETNVYFERTQSYGFEFPKDLKLTYHSPSYVRREWARYFEVLGIYELAISHSQDGVVLKKREMH